LEGENRVNLGATGSNVSKLCVGTKQWVSKVVRGCGHDYGETGVCACNSEAVSSGVNFFDRAELHGLGGSGRILGGCATGDRVVVQICTFEPAARANGAAATRSSSTERRSGQGRLRRTGR